LAIKKISRSLGSEERADLIKVRTKILQDISAPIVKNAFDTRRINQYTDVNPRRNLQYYHRSDPFIEKDSSEKIKTFFKLKIAVDSLKEDFLGDPEWLDSYCRILSATVDRTLRIDQKDMDFFKPQLDYLEELLYLRYRLKDDDIRRLSEKELRTLILDKDEKLLQKNIYANYNGGGLVKQNNSQPQFVKQNDTLIDKLFGDVKATAENKNVKRSINITVEDSIVDDKK